MEPNFEEAFSELQKTVTQLESGKLSLEESLKNFEKGVALVRTCQTFLSEAEKKIEILTKIAPDGTLQTKPFSHEPEGKN